MSLPVEELIAELVVPDRPLLNSRLAELSGLGPGELELFTGAWDAIETGRRHQIIYRLVEMAEDNIELNFDPIFKYCLADRDDDVRSKAIEGLWENEEPSLVESLMALLEKDGSPKVQAAAAMTLGKFALLAEYGKLRSRRTARIRECLLMVLADENRWLEVRSRALESVAPFSDPKVKSAIEAAYLSGDPELKISAVYAMGRNCAYDWLPLLLGELSSADAELRYEAAGALAELEAEEAVYPLTRLLDDNDVDVQMAAIRALGKIGGEEAKECLESCLDSDSQPLRDAAGETLRTLESTEDSLFS